MPDRIRIEEVVRTGVVLIHTLLHQPHPENPGVEVEILLSWPRNRGHVMQTVHTFHR